MKESTRKTYNGLDLGKFLCALLILFYHYFSEQGSLPRILDEALSLYAVAVALFMVMSGFLYSEKVKQMKTNDQRWNVTKRQVFHILKIYLLWSIPYLVYTISRWDFDALTVGFVLENVRNWIFNSTFYTIWFMPSCALGLLIVYYLERYLSPKMVGILALVAYVVGSCMLTYSFVGQESLHWQGFTAFVETWLGGARGGWFFGFPMIYLGGLIARGKKRVKWIPAAFLTLVFMLSLLIEALILRRVTNVHTGIDMCLVIPLVCVAIMWFLIDIPLKNNKYFLWMRKMSVLIFVSQRIFLSVLPAILPCIFNILFQFDLLRFIAICGGTITFSSICIYMSEKYTILKNLY